MHPTLIRTIWFAAIIVTAAIPSATSAATTCAVLPVGDLGANSQALVDLLEVKLSQNDAVEMLARQDLEKILAERSIQLSSLTTDRNAARNLGSILRVDLLVLIDEEKLEDSVLVEVKAVETRHGLRLVSEAFEIDDRVDRLVDLLARLVVEAASVDPKAFRYVFAIPPFELHSLSFEDAHLQHVFANVAANVIRSIPGAVVVDLAHAREVAEELATTSGRGTVERPLPYYIVGRFASDGIGDERRLTVTVELRRGEATLEKVEQSGLQAVGVVEFLQTKTVDLVARHLAMRRAPTTKYDRTLEAALLDERSRAAAARSDWVTAIELAEASLLLDAKRTDLHLRIVEYCIRFARVFPTWADPNAGAGSVQDGLPPAELLSPRDRKRYAQTGLHHARHVFLHVPSNEEAVGSAIVTVLQLFYVTSQENAYSYDWKTDPFSMKDLQLEIAKTEVELVHAVLTDWRMAPTLTRVPLWNVAGMAGVATDMWADLDLDGRVNAMKTLIRDFAGFDCGFHAQCRVVTRNWDLARNYPAVFDRLMAELSDDRHPQTSLTLAIVREVLTLRRREDADAVRQRIDTMIDTALSTTDACFTCENRKISHAFIPNYFVRMGMSSIYELPELQGCPPELDFVPMSPPAAAEPLPLQLGRLTWGGWVRGGEGTDFIHAVNRLHYMRDRGMPYEIRDLPSESKIHDVCWDGSYLWVVQAGVDDQITVLDGQSLKPVAVFGKKDGVPSTLRAARLAVVRPGQVCIAASFGRSWIGLITYDPKAVSSKPKKVEILFEAGNATRVRREDETVRANLDAVFDPSFAGSWDSNELGHRVVVIGRYVDVDRPLEVPYSVTNDLLVVDPATREVTQIPRSWKNRHPTPIPAQEGLYVYADQGLHLCAPPSMKCERLFDLHEPVTNTNATVGIAALARESAIHFWWGLYDRTERRYYSWFTTVDLERRRETRICRTNREIHGAKFLWTSHYGVVLQSSEGTWQVRLPD